MIQVTIVRLTDIEERIAFQFNVFPYKHYKMTKIYLLKSVSVDWLQTMHYHIITLFSSLLLFPPLLILTHTVLKRRKKTSINIYTYCQI